MSVALLRLLRDAHLLVPEFLDIVGLGGSAINDGTITIELLIGFRM